MKAGDLIYSEHDDEYAIYLHSNGRDGWITILYLGEKRQDQVQWWKKLYKI